MYVAAIHVADAVRCEHYFRKGVPGRRCHPVALLIKQTLNPGPSFAWFSHAVLLHRGWFHSPRRAPNGCVISSVVKHSVYTRQVTQHSSRLDAAAPQLHMAGSLIQVPVTGHSMLLVASCKNLSSNVSKYNCLPCNICNYSYHSMIDVPSLNLDK